MNITSLVGKMEDDDVVRPGDEVEVVVLGRCRVGLGSRRGVEVVVVVLRRALPGVDFGVGGFGTSGSIPKVQR